MSPGEIDREVMRRHLAALRESVQVLASHRGVTVDQLDGDTERPDDTSSE